MNNVYMENDLVYRFAQFVKATLPFLAAVYIFVGIALILKFVIKKSYVYINDLSEAVEMITKKDDEVIVVNKVLPERVQ